MATDIYVRIGDEFFEEVFKEKFKGFIVESDGHTIRIPTTELLEWLREKFLSRIDKAIEKSKVEGGI